MHLRRRPTLSIMLLVAKDTLGREFVFERDARVLPNHLNVLFRTHILDRFWWKKKIIWTLQTSCFCTGLPPLNSLHGIICTTTWNGLGEGCGKNHFSSSLPALLWWPFLWSSSFGALLLHPRCGQIWRGCTNGDEYLCFFVPSDSPPSNLATAKLTSIHYTVQFLLPTHLVELR